jgi:hypothetical protein
MQWTLLLMCAWRCDAYHVEAPQLGRETTMPSLVNFCCELVYEHALELSCREESMSNVMGNLDKVLAGKDSTLLVAVNSTMNFTVNFTVNVIVNFAAGRSLCLT